MVNNDLTKLKSFKMTCKGHKPRKRGTWLKFRCPNIFCNREVIDHSFDGGEILNTPLKRCIFCSGTGFLRIKAIKGLGNKYENVQNVS